VVQDFKHSLGFDTAGLTTGRASSL